MKRITIFLLMCFLIGSLPPTQAQNESPSARPTGFTLSSDGNMVAVATENGLIVYRIIDGILQPMWSKPLVGLVALKFSPQDSWLLAGTPDVLDHHGRVIIFDSQTGRTIRIIQVTQFGIGGITVSDDERYLVAVGADYFMGSHSSIGIWDTNTWAELPHLTFGTDYRAYLMDISPSNRYLAYVTSFEGVNVVDFASGEIITSTHAYAYVSKIYFEDDTHLVVVHNPYPDIFVDKWTIETSPDTYLLRTFHGGSYNPETGDEIEPAPLEESLHIFQRHTADTGFSIIDVTRPIKICDFHLPEKSSLRGGFSNVFSRDNTRLGIIIETDISLPDTEDISQKFVYTYSIEVLSLDTCSVLATIDVN